MKTKIIYSLIAGFALSCNSFAGTDAHPIPIGINELLHRVETASIPARKGYTMDVRQTIRQTDLGASASLITKKPRLIEEEYFTATCSTAGVVRAVKGLSVKPLTAGAINSTTGSPRVLLTFNPVAALRHLATLNSATINDEIYDGVPTTKVSGTDNGFQFVLWIGKTDATIRRQVILKDSDTLFDSTFIYTNVGGVQAPLHVITTKPSNGVQIVQDFSNHKF